MGAPSTPTLPALQVASQQKRTPPTVVDPETVSYTTLYSFQGGPDGPDGVGPDGDLIAVNGIFYGTTFEGGVNANGTVFAVNQSGAERVVYRFKGGTDGEFPTSGLVAMNGALYGTTEFGGTSSTTLTGGAVTNGTVFELSTSGTERVLYRFTGGADGALTNGDLIAVNGALYGTTAAGGANDGGTVFEVSPSGTERVLYSFKDGTDGGFPSAGLTAANGVFYGTAGGGDAKNDGTFFEVSPSGAERVLYRFKGGKDGSSPNGELILVNGLFYGTTYNGGASGNGTVFSVTPSGTERVLYSFKGGTDGQYPTAGLVAVNGNLYGSTQAGSINGGMSFTTVPFGSGTIFSVSPSGTERVLYRFPNYGGVTGGLIAVNGALYGAADGNIFKLSLPCENPKS